MVPVNYSASCGFRLVRHSIYRPATKPPREAFTDLRFLVWRKDRSSSMSKVPSDKQDQTGCNVSNAEPGPTPTPTPTPMPQGDPKTHQQQ
ncbi:hypothetical protein KCU81_g225, partial [Aureobasidium melanogenum]